MRYTVVPAISLAVVSLLQLPQVAAAPTTTSSAAASLPTICGDIVNNSTSNGTVVFYAKDVYDCLISVPFNADVATRFLKYYNDTIQFQSTLAYLRDPPTSYRQPAVDLIQGLNDIQSDVDAGVFTNQYDFEAIVLKLVYSAHDSHLELLSGILSVFSFGGGYDISSVSIDGIELPKVYFTDDLLPASLGIETDWEPSAISQINGIDTTEFLTAFAAANSFGGLEPHNDWNQLMASPALDIQGTYSIFTGGGTFYPGDDLVFTLENSTVVEDRWIAIYLTTGDTGPLETGGDFYNSFVLDFYPASYEEELNDDDDDDDDSDDSDSSSAVSSSTATDTSASTASSTVTIATATTTPIGWDTYGYPDADLAQQDLSLEGGGFLTGYFLNNSVVGSLGVLSIPSFDEYDDAVGTFRDFVFYFIQNATALGVQKIVIDVQQNSGGDDLLAVDTFREFFPQILPYGGSRKRAHDLANVIGQTTTTMWDNLPTESDSYYFNSTSEWVATDRLNAATGLNFSSWQEYYGPNAIHGDLFTTTQRDNLSSYIFDLEASGDIIVEGFDGGASTVPVFSAEDIIILTDGLCVSTCAVFMEMMHHEAGVRTVVAGGRPSFGPMQAPSGTRGAADYDSLSLDEDMALASTLNATAGSLLPNRDNNDLYISFSGFTIRDQVRRGETVPLQFVYEAADCRIFFTPQTVYNFTNLWNYAAEAIWSNSSLCVQGSQGFATTNTTVVKLPTDFPHNNVVTNSSDFYHITAAIPDFVLSEEAIILDGDESFNGQQNLNKKCKTDKQCGSRLKCEPVKQCGGTHRVCVTSCTLGGSCPSSSNTVGKQPCRALKGVSGTRTPLLGSLKSESVTPGYCYPGSPVCSVSDVAGLDR